jgi:hypothetical protein
MPPFGSLLRVPQRFNFGHPGDDIGLCCKAANDHAQHVDEAAAAYNITLKTSIDRPAILYNLLLINLLSLSIEVDII